jgi:hypothetical protein
MSAFVYKDGFGNLVGEDGEEAVVVEMKGDLKVYSLDSITNHDQYTDLKSPKQTIKKGRKSKKSL